MQNDPLPHWLGTPAPPQISPEGQLPQSSRPPQPSVGSRSCRLVAERNDDRIRCSACGVHRDIDPITTCVVACVDAVPARGSDATRSGKSAGTRNTASNSSLRWLPCRPWQPCRQCGWLFSGSQIQQRGRFLFLSSLHCCHHAAAALTKKRR